MALPSPKEFPKGLKDKKCFKCQSYGHLQYDCPNQWVMTMQEVKVVDAMMKEVQHEPNEANSNHLEDKT